MPIDINLLRVERGYDPEVVIQSEKCRGRSRENVDRVIDLDKKWREAIYNAEQIKKNLNAVNKMVASRKKSDPKDPCQDLLANSAEMKAKLPETDNLARSLEHLRDKALDLVGNIVHSSVPVETDENNNRVERTWGSAFKLTDNGCGERIDGCRGGTLKNLLHHHQILTKLGGVDLKKGAEVAGHRGYYLKGVGMLLNMAIVQYGLNFLMRRGYTPVQPPFFLRKDVMAGAAELADFEETLYHILHDKNGATDTTTSNAENQAVKATPTNNSQDGGKEDMYLIATSEQPLCALHKNDILEKASLPIRYAGYSTCFRKEAGSHGKDCWGLFRVHQFEKVEQFCIATPDQSVAIHEEMIACSEEFYQSLDIPYRLISIVSGALNNAASKKYDLEAWFPAYNDYKELVSCSNCTDYQSRALDVRLGHKKLGENEKFYVHFLNGTLVASQRCLCCILENYQTDSGVRVPRALLPYMGGQEFLHYIDGN